MKLGTFRHRDRSFVGAVIDDAERVLDLTSASKRTASRQCFDTMISLMQAGDEGLREAMRLAGELGQDLELCFELSDVEFLSPVPVPEQIRDMSLFPQHICAAPAGMLRIGTNRGNYIGSAHEAPVTSQVPSIFRNQPIFYFHNRHNVSGHGADVEWPRSSNVIDFELGFGMFIGRDGRNIRVEDATDYIFGYAIFNDFSARDLQFDEMQAGLGPAKSKSFDGANIIGPWIVTSDEIPDPSGLSLAVFVNGELWGESNSSTMLHKVDHIVSYLSRDETLKTGEFVGLGTVGCGCGLELGRYLQSGDVVELYVERIGKLRNRVVRRQPST